MPNAKGKLIVALDVDSFEKARKLVLVLSPAVDIFKIGSQLFTACGPAAARFVMAQGRKVFLDLKYHDIPNTVANAVYAAANLGIFISTVEEQKEGFPKSVRQGLFMLTVHTAGGKQMLAAAREAAQKKAEELLIPKPLLVGITVLTSDERKDDSRQIVIERAVMAQEAGLDGVVASVEEAAVLRKKFGDKFIIVTPGIRPSGAQANDQKRIATPKQAVISGSDFLVVGRPIVEAEYPLKAAQKILEEMAS